jgi:hypothetical protein
VGGEGGADHFVVLGQGRGIDMVAQALEQGRGALDVSKQEGQRLRGPSLTPGRTNTAMGELWREHGGIFISG